MIRITTPEPTQGASRFLDVDFRDGVAEVDELHPIRRQALEQHGFAVVDVIEGVKLERLKRDELLELAHGEGIDVPDGATKAEIISLINADPTIEVAPAAPEA